MSYVPSGATLTASTTAGEGEGTYQHKKPSLTIIEE